jgi:hypothetical protein
MASTTARFRRECPESQRAEWQAIKDEVGRYPAVKVSGTILSLAERRDRNAA